MVINALNHDCIIYYFTGKEEGDADETVTEDMSNLSVSADRSQNASGGSVQDTSALYPQWSKMSSSESEFSDTEGGMSNKLRSFHSRVRQSSLGCFYALIKVRQTPRFFLQDLNFDFICSAN